MKALHIISNNIDNSDFCREFGLQIGAHMYPHLEKTSKTPLIKLVETMTSYLSKHMSEEAAEMASYDIVIALNQAGLLTGTHFVDAFKVVNDELMEAI